MATPPTSPTLQTIRYRIPDIPRQKIFDYYYQSTTNKRTFEAIAKRYRKELNSIQSIPADLGTKENGYLSSRHLDRFPDDLTYDPSIDYREVFDFLQEEWNKPLKHYYEIAIDILPPYVFKQRNILNKTVDFKWWLSLASLDELLENNPESFQLIFSNVTTDANIFPDFQVGDDLKLGIDTLGSANDDEGDDAEFEYFYLYNWYTWIPLKLLYTNLSGSRIKLLRISNIDLLWHRVGLIEGPFEGTIRDLYNIIRPLIVQAGYNPSNAARFMVSKTPNGLIIVRTHIHEPNILDDIFENLPND